MNNDLISRSALKEHKFPIPLVGDYQQGWNDAIDAIIDNAPTVDAIPNKEGYEMYDKGYMSGYERGKEERPQGEWEESHIFSCGNILRMGMNVIEHKCKNCGGWSIKWARTIPDNFCSNCGARMEAENEYSNLAKNKGL